MKKENSKSPKNKAIQQEEDRWINVHNDDVMREMGFLRPFPQAPRYESVWRKTPNERRLLRNVKHVGKGEDMHFHSVPYKHIHVRAKLIIQLKKNKKYPNTTYSTECWMSNIPDILAKYQVTNPKTKYSESAVARYSFNGKIYAPNELPFWR